MPTSNTPPAAGRIDKQGRAVARSCIDPDEAGTARARGFTAASLPPNAVARAEHGAMPASPTAFAGGLCSSARNKHALSDSIAGERRAPTRQLRRVASGNGFEHRRPAQRDLEAGGVEWRWKRGEAAPPSGSETPIPTVSRPHHAHCRRHLFSGADSQHAQARRRPTSTLEHKRLGQH